MSALAYRLEIWNRTGTERLAILSLREELVRRRVLRGEETLRARVWAEDEGLSSLPSSAVLRVQQEGSTTATLWRLTAKTETLDASGERWVVLAADALWMDFRQGRVRQRLADGRVLLTFGLIGLTPASYLSDFILPGYDGSSASFALGDVEIATPLDLSFESTSPLAALRMLEEESGGEAEWELDPDTATYTLHLRSRVGSTTERAHLRYGVNLDGLERETQEQDIVTRLYAEGAGMLSLADCLWKVNFLSGQWIYFDDSPAFDGWSFDGLYLAVAGKGAWPIVGTNLFDNGALEISGAHTIAVGDLARLTHDAAGLEALEYIETDASAEYGVRPDTLVRDDIPDARNLISNAYLTSWSGGLPANWEAVGTPTISESADPQKARWGARTARVEANQADEGIRTLQFWVEDAEAMARAYHALRAGLTLVLGQVRMELQGPGGVVYPLTQQPHTTSLFTYTELTAGPVHDAALPAGWYQLAFLSHGGPAEWYLDYGMVTPVVGSEVPEPVEVAGALELWTATVEELLRRGSPRVEYRVSAADLYRLDPDAYPTDRFDLGDAIRVTDPEMGGAGLRIVEMEEDLLHVDRTTLSVAEGPETRAVDELTRFLPQPRPRRPRGGVAAYNASRPAIERHDLSEDGDDITISVVANPPTASVELYTKTVATDPWPATPTATLAAREGSFAPFTLAANRLYYQLRPYDAAGVVGYTADGMILRDRTPFVEPVVEFNDVFTLAWVSLYLRPRVGSAAGGERATLRMKVGEGVNGVAPTILQLVTGAGSSTPLYLDPDTAAGSSSYWWNGTATEQPLNAITLPRDRIANLYVQVLTEDSLIYGEWQQVSLRSKGQPWFEHTAARWEAEPSELVVETVAGAFAQSLRLEIDSVDTFGSPDSEVVQVNLADGEQYIHRRALSGAQLGKTWYVKWTLYSKPLSGGVIDFTGLASTPVIDEVYVRDPETTKVLRISHQAFRPYLSTMGYTAARLNMMPAAGESQLEVAAPLILPVGVTITSLDFRSRRSDVNDTVKLTLYRIRADDSITNLQEVWSADSTGVSHTASATLATPEVVEEDAVYLLEVFISWDQVGTTPSFLWVRVHYTAPDERHTL